MTSFSVQNLFHVGGKVVLVTGGSRGLGKMISTGFIKNGAKVYITSRSGEECNATASELTALGPGTCIAIPADLQRYEEVERLVTEISSREKALHVLVNNAGAVWVDGVDDYPDAAFSKVLTLNLQRVFSLTQKLLPLLRAAAVKSEDGESYVDPARIINIGSVEGLSVFLHESYAYSASKAGLHHLSRHLAGKLGPEGIASNTIACGLFASKMTAAVFANDGGKGIVSNVPLRRAGKPEDIAGTAVFLASPAGAYITGATISLDGGMPVAMPSKL